MLKPSALFSDGAVLCRDKEIRIFGDTDAGAELRIELRGPAGELLAEAACAAAEDGRFLALLPPQPARSGCALRFIGKTEECGVRDVAIGDVYLAGGQSNMEWELRYAQEGPEEIASHEDPQLRFFTVPRKAYVCDDQRQAFDSTRWEAVTPGGNGSVSAVAYFFAAALRKRHPDIPVGIIGCYWGGTSVTCWMPEETLRRLEEGRAYLERDAQLAAGKSMETYLREEAVFRENLDAWSLQVEQYKQEHPGAPWRDIQSACGPCPWNPPAGPGSPYRPGGLVDSMLLQVVPVTLTGILFYQGESDADLTEHYDELMLAMLLQWRKLFRDADLPFLFVQLPMWLDWDAADTFRWPALRLAQAAVRDTVRHTGMICLLDEGEYGNLHPTAKRVVGERLHRLAETMLYGEPGGESPRATGKYTMGRELTVTLSEPVAVRNGGAPALLEIAGADGAFHPADGRISGKELRLRSPEVPCPVHARYAWTDWSDQVNLFGFTGLPLEPFCL